MDTCNDSIPMQARTVVWLWFTGSRAAPILGIAPFNFPLNLVAHKVAPALAVGAPIIVKPAPATPLSSLVLGELLAETSLPEGAWSVLTVSNEKASEMVQDPRLPVVSFTGSVPVGWAIRDRGAAKTRHARIGRKRRRRGV